MFLQSSSVRVAKIPRWLRVVSRTPMDQSSRREECCHYLDESLVQHTVREALAKPGLTKRATCHTFQHLFATYGLNRGQAGGCSGLGT